MKNPYSSIFHAVDSTDNIFNLFSSLNDEKQGIGIGQRSTFILELIFYLSCYLLNKCYLLNNLLNNFPQYLYCLFY